MRRNPSLGARASLRAPQMGMAQGRDVAASFYKAILAVVRTPRAISSLCAIFLISL